MSDCLFCKIVKGEIPCNKVYENDKVLAFLDIAPVHKGHTLVIPKEHYVNLLDIPDDLLAEVQRVSKMLAKAIIEAVDTDGFDIVQSNGETGGQVIFHYHNHIIPRFKNDGLKFWPHGEYKEGEDKKVKEKIVSFLNQ